MVPWGLPSTTNFPEWVVGVNGNWSCEQLLPGMPTFSTITGYNKIGPNGNNSWCYAVLGKNISDAGVCPSLSLTQPTGEVPY